MKEFSIFISNTEHIAFGFVKIIKICMDRIQCWNNSSTGDIISTQHLPWGVLFLVTYVKTVYLFVSFFLFCLFVCFTMLRINLWCKYLKYCLIYSVDIHINSATWVSTYQHASLQYIYSVDIHINSATWVSTYQHASLQYIYKFLCDICCFSRQDEGRLSDV
jgi:hypothetical protein